jgi:hypothetical protein
LISHSDAKSGAVGLLIDFDFALQLFSNAVNAANMLCDTSAISTSNNISSDDVSTKSTELGRFMAIEIGKTSNSVADIDSVGGANEDIGRTKEDIEGTNKDQMPTKYARNLCTVRFILQSTGQTFIQGNF